MSSLHSVVRIGGLLLLALFLLTPPPTAIGRKTSPASTNSVLSGPTHAYAPDQCSPVLLVSAGPYGFTPWAGE